MGLEAGAALREELLLFCEQLGLCEPGLYEFRDFLFAVLYAASAGVARQSGGGTDLLLLFVVFQDALYFAGERLEAEALERGGEAG